jgi:hypothetical protein
VGALLDQKKGGHQKLEESVEPLVRRENVQRRRAMSRDFGDEKEKI